MSLSILPNYEVDAEFLRQVYRETRARGFSASRAWSWARHSAELAGLADALLTEQAYTSDVPRFPLTFNAEEARRQGFDPKHLRCVLELHPSSMHVETVLTEMGCVVTPITNTDRSSGRPHPTAATARLGDEDGCYRWIHGPSVPPVEHMGKGLSRGQYSHLRRLLFEENNTDLARWAEGFVYDERSFYTVKVVVVWRGVPIAQVSGDGSDVVWHERRDFDLANLAVDYLPEAWEQALAWADGALDRVQEHLRALPERAFRPSPVEAWENYPNYLNKPGEP